MEPQVAIPPRPDISVDIGETLGVKIHQAYVGGCTGGSIEDMRMAAEILRGRKVHPEVRAIIVPGTGQILEQMIVEGLTKIFNDAGAQVTPPYCGPCQMICVGHLGNGETMIGTHPRNQPGRAAHDTKTYLANPYTTAASAVAGKIVDPRDYL
jgi:3-isopropylmalate/(R)-2-methylmalate dehydratase large subunit